MALKKYSRKQWRLSKLPKTKICTWACRCGVKYSVHSNDPDLHLLPKRIKCWPSGSIKCRYYLNRDDKKQGVTVRAIELFRVIQGLGTEQERKCTPVELKKLLGKKLISMAIAQVPGQDRSLIDFFTLEGGIRVHLAPSTKGVTVYKVTHE